MKSKDKPAEFKLPSLFDCKAEESVGAMGQPDIRLCCNVIATRGTCEYCATLMQRHRFERQRYRGIGGTTGPKTD